MKILLVRKVFLTVRRDHKGTTEGAIEGAHGGSGHQSSSPVLEMKRRKNTSCSDYDNNGGLQWWTIPFWESSSKFHVNVPFPTSPSPSPLSAIAPSISKYPIRRGKSDFAMFV